MFSLEVSNHLAVIILHLCQHCSIRLEWTLVIFIIVATPRNSHSVLLELSEGECYLYLLVVSIYLGLPEDCKLH